MPLGLIAGNGRFPVLALQAARKAGLEVVAIGIKEEASPEIEPLAARCHWISLGQLSKLIDLCHKEGISHIMMCGQVKHAKIFSSIVPDWRLVKLLASIETKNTEGLIGAVAKVLADEGIELADSTLLLKDLLAPEGILTRRKPDADEQRDLDYGRRIASALSAIDIGQSVADRRSRLRGGGSDGRHRRHAATCRVAGCRQASAAGEGIAAPETSAVRCTGRGSANHCSNDGNRNHGSGHRRGPDPVNRPGRSDREGERREYRHACLSTTSGLSLV